jgi:hypothetical protein
LTLRDFNVNYKIEELPSDYECPLCMMVKEDMIECKKCYQGSCKGCLEAFSKSAGRQSPGVGKYECTICHYIGEFHPMNKIVAEVF